MAPRLTRPLSASLRRGDERVGDVRRLQLHELIEAVVKDFLVGVAQRAIDQDADRLGRVDVRQDVGVEHFHAPHALLAEELSQRPHGDRVVDCDERLIAELRLVGIFQVRPPAAELDQPVLLGQLDAGPRLEDFDLLRRPPPAFVELVALLPPEVGARDPLALEELIAQCVPGLLMVRIDLDHPPQMSFALPAQPLLAAPLGQRPLPFDRVGRRGNEPAIFELGRRLPHGFLHLGQGQRQRQAVGRPHQVPRQRLLGLVEPFALDLAARFEAKDVGPRRGGGRDERHAAAAKSAACRWRAGASIARYNPS